MAGKPPFFQSAAVYRIGERLLINPYERTRDGVRQGMAVVAVVSLDDASDIGRKVLDMLRHCRDNVPDDYTRRAPAPGIAVILNEVKLKTWSAFHKKASVVGVYRKKGASELEILPSRREGGGSIDIDDKTRFCSAEPEDLGQTILAAMADTQ